MVDIPRIDAQQMREVIWWPKLNVQVTDDLEGDNKIVRVTVTGGDGSNPANHTLQAVAELRRRVFDLDIRYVREASDSMQRRWAERHCGMDDAWSEFLLPPVGGLNRGRLLKDGLSYLRGR